MYKKRQIKMVDEGLGGVGLGLGLKARLKYEEYSCLYLFPFKIITKTDQRLHLSCRSLIWIYSEMKGLFKLTLSSYSFVYILSFQNYCIHDGYLSQTLALWINNISSLLYREWVDSLIAVILKIIWAYLSLS